MRPARLSSLQAAGSFSDSLRRPALHDSSTRVPHHPVTTALSSGFAIYRLLGVDDGHSGAADPPLRALPPPTAAHPPQAGGACHRGGVTRSAAVSSRVRACGVRSHPRWRSEAGGWSGRRGGGLASVKRLEDAVGRAGCGGWPRSSSAAHAAGAARGTPPPRSLQFGCRGSSGGTKGRLPVPSTSDQLSRVLRPWWWAQSRSNRSKAVK
jgi:hypothetical protein